MLIRNDTPFAAMGFGNLHRDGMTMAVICVRGSYNLSSEGGLWLADRQEIALNDIYEGDPHSTPLVRVSDLIPFKPAADVTLLGSAHAPGGQPSPTWEVGIAVGSHEVRLRVHGPRQWQPKLKLLKPTWKLGAAEPAVSVPLDWRLAAGGRFAGDPESAGDPRNPLGPGILHRQWSRVGVALRAPQIEAADTPLSNPFALPQPQGFAPIPPFWPWREGHCGTRDEAWARERCPRMPTDFDYRFFQSAHPDLIRPRLAGDETLRLDGLMCGGRDTLTFALPGLAPIAHHQWFDGRRLSARLTLDGLHLDLRGPEGLWRVDLTWRGWVLRCPAYHGAVLEFAALDQTTNLPVSDEGGLADPRPPVEEVTA